MKVSEAIQRVQSLYSRGVQSDDSRLMSRHIWNKLLGARATLLIQKSNKRQPFSQWIYQTIPCIELIPAAPYECPCIPPAGCVWLRSKNPFPEPLVGLEGNLIQSVTSLDGSMVFDLTTFATQKYESGNKYTAKKPKYLLYDKYLFVTVIKKLKVVTATVLANDPMQVWNFPSFCQEDCADCCPDILENEFPLDRDLTETAIQMASNELIGIFVQLKKDNANDSVDDALVSNMIHQPNNPG